MNKEEKKVPVLDLVNYISQHNLSVDMACACIMHNRMQNVEPKAIVFNPKYFEIFKAWVYENYGEEAACKEFYIDGVEIRCERIISGKIMVVEHYPKPKAEA